MVRRAEMLDMLNVERFLNSHEAQARLREIILDAVMRPGKEYVVALALTDDRQPQAIAAYGMVAGTIATGEMFGVVPVSSRTTELLSFVAHDLKECGALQIVAEFPDTDEFKPYRDVLLESGYDPTGLVEDFYRDGVAMVIFTRKLTA